MRTIKFRAWDADIKRMVSVEGNIARLHDGEVMLIKPSLILMQFTGLLDKDGREIYEGDIIEHDQDWYEADNGSYGYERAKGVVDFHKGMWTLDGDTSRWLDVIVNRKDYLPEGDDESELEGAVVIGNVYENEG